MTVSLSKTKWCFTLAGILVGLVILTACLLEPAPVITPAKSQVATPFSTLTSTLPFTPTVTLTSTPTPTPTATLTATAEIVCPTGNCAYSCLSKLRSFLNGPGQPLSPPSSVYPHPGRSLKMVTLVTYQIEGDQISSPKFAPNLSSDLLPYQTDSPAQQRIWDFFAKILPPDQRTEIKTFIIATDGRGGVLASISLLNADLTNWQLNVDIVDAIDPTNMTYTLLHEFGHLLTLDSSQQTPDLQLLNHPNDQKIYTAEASTCPQFLTSEGCSKPDSYINDFYQKFWVELFDTWATINAETDSATYDRKLGEFYHAHQDQFVTPYSATSPEEDIAESWAHFIFDVKPNGNTIARKKILFFYDYPYLVNLRNQIVNGICLYSQGK
jgi:hypothetical protein